MKKFLFFYFSLILNLCYSNTPNPYIEDFNTIDNWTNVYGQANTGIHNGELCYNIIGTYIDDDYYSFESDTLNFNLWSQVDVEFTIASNLRNSDVFAFYYYDGATMSWAGYDLSGLFGTYTVTIPTTTTLISFDLSTFSNGNTNGKYAHVDILVLTDPISALPVELISFEGENQGNENYITWITASEINCKDFVLERSIDAKTWNVVRTVSGSGTSSTMTEYEIVDRYFKPELNYYRLTQYDYDGKSETFNLICIDNTIIRKKVVKLLNSLGQEIPLYSRGVVIEVYEDGTSQKVYYN